MDTIDSLRTASLQSHNDVVSVGTPRHHQHSVIITTPTPPSSGVAHPQHSLGGGVLVGGRTVAIANPRVRSSDPNVPSLIRSIVISALDVDASDNESSSILDGLSTPSKQTTPGGGGAPLMVPPIINPGDTVALHYPGIPAIATTAADDGDHDASFPQPVPKFAKVLSPRNLLDSSSSNHDGQVRFKVGQRLQRRGDGLVSTHVLLADLGNVATPPPSTAGDDGRQSPSLDTSPAASSPGEYILKLIRFDTLTASMVSSSSLPDIEAAVEADFRHMTKLGSRNIEHVVTVQNLVAHRLAVVTKRINPAGIPLHEWRPANELDITVLIRDVCKALRYCGTHGIRHRHLSATNVYVVFSDSEEGATAAQQPKSGEAPPESLYSTQESYASPPARIPHTQSSSVLGGSSMSVDTHSRRSHHARPSQFVVTGFGLAALFSTMSASQLWDMGYRDVAAFPPELISSGTEGSSDEQMDLWAIGCMAYEALFHCHLYENDATDGIALNRDELFDIIASQDPVPFPWSSGVITATSSGSRGSVSSVSELESSRRPPDPALVAIIRKLLSKDPTQRGTIDGWLKQLSRSGSVASSARRSSMLSPIRISSFRRSETEDTLLTTTTFGTATILMETQAAAQRFNMGTSPSSALAPPPRRLRNSVSIAPAVDLTSPLQTDVTTATTTHNNSITTPYYPPSRQLSLGALVLGVDATTIVISSFAGTGSGTGSGVQDSLQSSHRLEPLQPPTLYHVHSFSIPHPTPSAALGAPRPVFACAICQRDAHDDGSAMLCRTCFELGGGSVVYSVCRSCYDSKHDSPAEWPHPAHHNFDLHIVDDVSMPSFVNPATPWALPNGLNDFTAAAASFYLQSHSESSMGSSAAFVMQRQNTSRRSSSVPQPPTGGPPSASRAPQLPRPPMYPSSNQLRVAGYASKNLNLMSSPDQQPRSNDTTASITPPTSPGSANLNMSSAGSGAAAVRRIIPARLLSKREQSILEMGGSLAASCAGTGLLDAERRHLTKAPRRLSLHIPMNPSSDELSAQGETIPMAASTTTPTITKSRIIGLADTSNSSVPDYSGTFSTTLNPDEVSALGATPATHSHVLPKSMHGHGGDAGAPIAQLAEEDRSLTVDELIEECAASDSSALLLNDMVMDQFPLVVVSPSPMVHITILDLANNLLTDIPDSIEFLVNLRRLLLGNNKLTSLPESIGNLTDLEHLDVNHNLLTTLPQSLMFCDQMEVLALDYNAFTEIPCVVFDLPSLKMLYLLEVPIVEWPSVDILQNAVVEGNLTIGIDNIPDLVRTLPSCVKLPPPHHSAPNHPGLIYVVWNKRFPDFVIPGVFVGSVRSAQSLDVYEKLNITHVLTMGRGLDALPPPGGHHKVVIVDDLPGACIDFAFEDAVAFIDDAVQSGGAVVVHCFAGMSRSATTVIAYLMMKRGMRLDDAYNTTKRGRPAIYPNGGFFDQLLKLDAALFPGQRALDIASMEREKVP